MADETTETVTVVRTWRDRRQIIMCKFKISLISSRSDPERRLCSVPLSVPIGTWRSAFRASVSLSGKFGFKSHSLISLGEPDIEAEIMVHVVVVVECERPCFALFLSFSSSLLRSVSSDRQSSVHQAGNDDLRDDFLNQ